MVTQLKAITLWQPWASLIGRGKVHETRSWPTKHRGPLAIHAAVRKPPALPAPVEARVCDALGADWRETAPRGAIVSVARVTGCRPTDEVPYAPDQAFGDFSPGRWAWSLDDIALVHSPIPATGHQGLWYLPDTVAAELQALGLWLPDSAV